MLEKIMKDFFRSSLLTSTILIILGILLLFASEATITIVVYVIGALVIAIGATGLIRFFTNNIYKSSLDLAYGIVSIVLGVIIIKNPNAVASIFPIILGIAIIISSATKMQYAFQLKDNKNDLWKKTMVISILSTICGIVLLFNPFKSAVALTMIVGIFIIVYGVLDIISTIMIKKDVDNIHKAIEGTITDAQIISDDTTDDDKDKKKSKKDKTTKKED
jgi:uncharacterized membrane protein HdeD (DUF308 family)